MEIARTVMRASFKYLRPSSPADAVKMKAEYGPGAQCWAGGTDMSLHWQHSKVHPDYCIDLTFLSELDYIKVHQNIRMTPMRLRWSHVRFMSVLISRMTFVTPVI